MTAQNIVTAITEAPCAEKHNAARCLSCMIDNLLLQDANGVDMLHDHGFISDDMHRAYGHMWAVSATRDESFDHLRAYPETAAAQHLAKIMSRRIPNPSYC